ncbi:AAA family ATPase [Lentzea sp. NPDC004789]
MCRPARTSPRGCDEAATVPAELLDRAAELAALERAVTTLVAGQPALAEISGGSGSGRSALLARAVDLARGAGVLVLTANGLPLVPRADHRIVGEVMAQIGGGQAGAAAGSIAAGLPEPGAGPASAHLPGAVAGLDAAALGAPSDTAVADLFAPPWPGVTPAEALLAVLELARIRPVLLAIDDTDGYDERSRAWLTRLGERAGAGGRAIGIVLVTGLGRRVLAEAVVLTARPLPRDAVAELAARRWPVSESMAGELHRSTGGLPSVLHAVLDRLEPGLPAGDLAEPAARADDGAAAFGDDLAELAAEAFGDVVVRALAGLPDEAAQLLRAMALCGPRLDLDLACAVAGLRELGRRRALELLAAAGLISGEPPIPVGGVTADGLLAGLASEARDELHLRAARLAYLGAADVEEVARILASAPPLGEPWVVPVLRLAAGRAVARGEPEAAVRCLERALREPCDPGTEARLVLEIALAEGLHAPEAGDRRLARMLLERRPPECARVHLAAADQLFARGDAALARRTFGAMPAAGVERDSATAMYWLVDDAPLEVPELGLLDAAPLPVAPPEPERAGAVAWLHVARGADAALARDLARSALAAPAAVLVPRMHAACALAFTGDLDEGVAGLDDVVAEARDRGLRAVVSQSLAVRAKLMLAAARLGEARADVDAALAALPLHHWHPDGLPLLVGVDAELSLEDGFVGRAEELVASVPGHETGFGYGRALVTHVRAELALRRGDAGTAYALAEECGRRMLARRWRNPATLPWRSVAARAAFLLGLDEQAELLCSYEISSARAWGVPGVLGMAHLGRAAVSGDRHDVTEAVRLLRTSPYRLAYATALLELAELTPAGDARPLVCEAAGIAVRGRAAALLARARRLGWEPGS